MKRGELSERSITLDDLQRQSVPREELIEQGYRRTEIQRSSKRLAREQQSGESATEPVEKTSRNSSKPDKTTLKPSDSTKDVHMGGVFSGKGGQRREPFQFQWGNRLYDLDPDILVACAVMYRMMVEQLDIIDSFSEVLGHSFAYVARTLGVQTAPLDNIARQEAYNDGRERQEIERFIAEPGFSETEGDGEGDLGNGQSLNQEALAD